LCQSSRTDPFSLFVLVLFVRLFLLSSPLTFTYPLSLHDALPICQTYRRVLFGGTPRKACPAALCLSDRPSAKYSRRFCLPSAAAERKTTRLNSSHVSISYAVVCS